MEIMSLFIFNKMKIVAKIFLLNKKNEFLLYLRDNISGIPCPGEWDAIGGGINKGEKLIKGLQREIQEEIPGCDISNIKFIGETYAESDSGLNIIGYSINKDYKMQDKKNLLHQVNIFKGRINNDIEYINKVLTEGQKAGYFKFNKFPRNMSALLSNFVYKNKHKIL